MKKISATILAAALGCAPLFAQTTLTDTVQQVVISANKTVEQKRDIPNQIEVISAKQIQRLSPQTTADALQNTGEVFVQKSQQGGGSPVLRGFEANRVLLVVDGVRMNNAIFRAGHLQNVITIDPAALDRIEVLHGAGSVIYGTDAIGGVISLFTKRPQLSMSGKTEAQLGGFLRYATANNGTTAHANFNVGGSKWANYLAVTANDFGDLRSGTRDLKCDTCRSGKYDNFGDRPFYVERVNGKDSVFTNDDPDVQKLSGYRQIDLLEKFLLVSGNFRHTLNLQFSTTTDIPRYDRLTERRNGKARFADWYYGPQDRLLASYQLEYQANAKFVDIIRLTPAYQKVRESRHDRALNNPVRNNRMEDVSILSANLDLFKKAGEHEIRYGAEFVHNDLESVGVGTNVNTGAEAPITSRYPNGTYTTSGVYASHRWEILGEKLILSDGLRFSTVKMDATFDPAFYFAEDLREVAQSSSSVNFNLGLVSNLPGGLRIAAMASSGFRNPNIDDAAKVFENVAGTLNIPNPDLKPEQVLHSELTLGYTLDNALELSATGFVSNLTDAIATRPTTYNGQSFIVYNSDTLAPVHSTNVAKAQVVGFSLRGKVRFAENFTLGGGIQYVEGKDKTNDVPLDHIPPVVGNVRFGWEKGNWRAETDVLWNGWKRIADYSPSGEDNQQYATPDGMPAWQTWNVRGGWQATKHLRLQVAVENILDVNYRVFASGINGAGRNFVVGVHWQ